MQEYFPSVRPCWSLTRKFGNCYPLTVIYKMNELQLVNPQEYWVPIYILVSFSLTFMAALEECRGMWLTGKRDVKRLTGRRNNLFSYIPQISEMNCFGFVHQKELINKISETAESVLNGTLEDFSAAGTNYFIVLKNVHDLSGTSSCWYPSNFNFAQGSQRKWRNLQEGTDLSPSLL